MSDIVFEVLAGVLQALTVGLLFYLLNKIDGIQEKLGKSVSCDQCREEMTRHEQAMDEIMRQIHEQEIRITRLEK